MKWAHTPALLLRCLQNGGRRWERRQTRRGRGDREEGKEKSNRNGNLRARRCAWRLHTVQPVFSAVTGSATRDKGEAGELPCLTLGERAPSVSCLTLTPALQLHGHWGFPRPLWPGTPWQDPCGSRSKAGHQPSSALGKLAAQPIRSPDRPCSPATASQRLCSVPAGL